MEFLSMVKKLIPSTDDEMAGNLMDVDVNQMMKVREEMLAKIDATINSIGFLDQSSLGKRPRDRVAETHIPWKRFCAELDRGDKIVPLR